VTAVAGCGAAAEFAGSRSLVSWGLLVEAKLPVPQAAGRQRDWWRSPLSAHGLPPGRSKALTTSDARAGTPGWAGRARLPAPRLGSVVVSGTARQPVPSVDHAQSRVTAALLLPVSGNCDKLSGWA
jgi:hypothetical protein